jgi:hypothetical protein
MEEWIAQRNAAQVILGAYGTSVVAALPGAVRHYLLTLPAGEATDAYIARLAVQLEIQMSGVEDPLTGATMQYPLGRDVVIAAIASNAATGKEHIREEANLCVKTTYILTEVGKSKALRNREGGVDAGVDAPYDAIAAGSGVTATAHKQIILPLVFGAKYPISARDVAAVNEHFPEKEDRCMKCITAFSAAGAVDTPRIALAPAVCMDAGLLHARLTVVAETLPGLLLRALCELGFLGPAFFRGRVFLAEGAPYPFGSKTLILAYADWMQRQVERPRKTA